MNERIKELMVELKETVSTHRGAEVLIGYDEIEKFAELIIAECIDVFSKDLPDTTSPDYQLGSLPEVVNRIANVAEHFGDKE
jgi:hypothetical protein